MSLVANYGSSDSESSDTETTVTPIKDISKTETSKSSTSSLGSLLPPPKKQSGSGTSSKSVIYVDLPGTQKSDEEEEDDEAAAERRAKRARLKAPASTSIADLLPAPKNKFPASRAPPPNLIVPSAVARKAKKDSKETLVERKEAERSAEDDSEEKTQSHLEEAAQQEQAKEENEEQEEEELTHDGPIFRLGTEVTKAVPPPSSSYSIPTRKQQPLVENETNRNTESSSMAAVDMYEYDPNAMYAYGGDPSAYYQYWQPQQEQQVASNEQDSNANGTQELGIGELDDDTLIRLTGKRKRAEGTIKIKDVNQADILPSDEWRSRLEQTAAPTFMSSAPAIQASGLQKRKNNLLALAAQAQTMQERLNEQYAANRKTKNESRRKYGF